MPSSNISETNIESTISSIPRFNEDEHIKIEDDDTKEKNSEMVDGKVLRKKSSRSKRQSPVKSAKHSGSPPPPPRRWIGRTNGYVPPRWINPNSSPPVWSAVLPKVTTRWEYNSNVLPSHKPPLYPLPKRKPTQRKPMDPKQREEHKYQDFVAHLKKDIDAYLRKSLRESRFDPTGNACVRVNSSLVNSNVSVKQVLHEKPSDSVINFEDSLSSMLQHEPLALLKKPESKRLISDVNTILAMKHPQTRFSQHRKKP